MPLKMREIAERQRLGPKKVWLFEKLPPIDLSAQSKTDLNSSYPGRGGN